MLSLSEYFGLAAGLFQLGAYLVYIRYFVADTIRPNPLSWVMFAYGTSLMVFLEWKGGASWDLLILPGVCGIMSIVVALMCVRQPAREPIGKLERGAFFADLALTMSYLLVSVSAVIGPLFAAAFIAAGNVTTLTAFVPILLSTWRSPQNEKIAPWLLWATAYGLLAISTVLAVGTALSALLIYPLVCLGLHGSIAFMVLRTQKSPSATLGEDPTVYIASSEIAGSGIFAIQKFDAGERICVLTGSIVKGPVKMEVGPNWVGIGKDIWIDPLFPIDHINHSCEPNAAFSEGLILRALRPIGPDEEVTMDYSTTEVDLDWRMACACATPTCRHSLTAIQIAFAGSSQPPPALPAMQEIWRAAQTTRHVTAPAKSDRRDNGTSTRHSFGELA